MKPWEANIRKVVPYTPGEQPNESGMIKLNTNENPYSPAPGVEKALKVLDADTLRLYPDPTAGDLVHSIAAFYGLKDEQVFTGVGSDDVLAMCFLTFFNSEKPILFPDITYSFYDVWADLLRIPYERPALDEEFHIRKEDYFRENGGIVIPNPNAPTGVEMPLSEIEEIVAKNPESIVIVDEAYVDFGAASALPLIEKYDNLLVVQTFSKSRSLAGMRIGYAFGNPELIKYQGMDSVYDWEMTRLCKEMKELDIPLEINMLGMGEGARHYPAERFWKIAGEVGNKAILGLDAHCVRHIQNMDSYRKCMELVEKYNLNLINKLEL